MCRRRTTTLRHGGGARPLPSTGSLTPSGSHGLGPASTARSTTTSRSRPRSTCSALTTRQSTHGRPTSSSAYWRSSGAAGARSCA
eukprot:5169250-Pyramimonas_sp.AAC.1